MCAGIHYVYLRGASTKFPLTVSVRGNCFAVHSSFCGIFYWFRLD